MQHAILTKNLSKSYGRTPALQDVCLRVSVGTVYALLGPNGAGKSTTLAILLGLLPASAGSVELFGKPWKRDTLERIGASINGPALYAHLSAWENLEVHARLLGLSPQRIGETLEQVGLGDTGRKPAGKFSTGMKSRLALAVALLNKPDLLILDEPQNGLDPEGIRELRTLLRDYAGEGRTVLVSSHLLGEVAQLADEIGVLAHGRLRYQGPRSELAPTGTELEEAYLALTQKAAA